MGVAVLARGGATWVGGETGRESCHGAYCATGDGCPLAPAESWGAALSMGVVDPVLQPAARAPA